MSYIINQYNKTDVDNNIFMTSITQGTAKTKRVKDDNGVTSAALINPFEDECVYCSNGFTVSNNYYFHAKIKRMNTEQVFYIYLTYYDSEKTETQFIKDIRVKEGDTSEWVDVEFIFTPLAKFDTILFSLQRTINDYRVETRKPIILYEELSLINNIITSKIGNNIQLQKMGVQSRPGLLMCINGAEIRIGLSGIYEIRNSPVYVTFFSVVAASTDSVVTNEYLNNLQSSTCIFSNTTKTRNIDKFILDYGYEEV